MNEKIAIVTGAAGIIGPGICESLAQAGWKVAAHALDDRDWIVHEKISGSPFPASLKVEGDLSSRDACHRVAAVVQETLGPISLVVNNAAFNPAPAPALEGLTEEYAQLMLGVNLLAPLFLVQACLADLKNAQGASIINIGSIQSETPIAGQILYPVAKAGLETLTRILARDLAEFKVRSNLIRVGSVPGPAFMWSALRDLPDEKARQLYQEMLPIHLQKMARMNPTGEVAKSEAVGQLVAFLASPAASQINGASIPLDGGLSCAVQFPSSQGPAWNPLEELEKWLKAHQS